MIPMRNKNSRNIAKKFDETQNIVYQNNPNEHSKIKIFICAISMLHVCHKPCFVCFASHSKNVFLSIVRITIFISAKNTA